MVLLSASNPKTPAQNALGVGRRSWGCWLAPKVGGCGARVSHGAASLDALNSTPAPWSKLSAVVDGLNDSEWIVVVYDSESVVLVVAYCKFDIASTESP